MNRILLLTAALLVAFTVNAFAVDAGSPDDEQGTVTVLIPGIFHLDLTGTADYGFTPSEAQILAGSSLTSGPLGTLHAYSNYNSTDINVSRSTWLPVGNPLSDGDFVLKTKKYGDSGFNTTIDDVTPVLYGTWLDGANNAQNVINYELSGLGVEDDPDTYSTTVTYSMTHP
jgi:hypothetical protein